VSDKSPLDKLREDIESVEETVTKLRIHNAVLDKQLEQLKEDVDALPGMYVLVADFEPIKRYVNLGVLAVLGLFFTALGAIVFGSNTTP
jgi:hypothetical protein